MKSPQPTTLNSGSIWAKEISNKSNNQTQFQSSQSYLKSLKAQNTNLVFMLTLVILQLRIEPFFLIR